MRTNYDTVAPFYDRIARFVYGDTLICAQRYLLFSIRPATSILIAGGGTGWILEELGRVCPQGLNITYIDSSPKMIALAKSRNAGANNIEFITAPVETISPERQYDTIITPFLLDNFTEAILEQFFPVINPLLKPEGLWLYCDFQNTASVWQRMLLKTMYLFFRITCGIKASHLPDADNCFHRYGYEAMNARKFMDGFIIAAVYKRS